MRLRATTTSKRTPYLEIKYQVVKVSPGGSTGSEGSEAGSEGARQRVRGSEAHVILGFRVPTTCYDIIWGKGARGRGRERGGEAGSEGARQGARGRGRERGGARGARRMLY